MGCDILVFNDLLSYFAEANDDYLSKYHLTGNGLQKQTSCTSPSCKILWRFWFCPQWRKIFGSKDWVLLYEDDKAIKMGVSKKHMRFKALEIWQVPMQLCKNIYVILRDCKDCRLKYQMQRAAVSILSNIADEYECKGSKKRCVFMRCGRFVWRTAYAIIFGNRIGICRNAKWSVADRWSSQRYRYIVYHKRIKNKSSYHL